MINLMLPVIVCWKCHATCLQNKTKNFFGFTGFLSTPNDCSLTRLQHFFTFIHIPRIVITVHEIVYIFEKRKNVRSIVNKRE